MPSLAGTKVSICTTPQNSDLSLTAYAALTYVLVGGVGRIGQFGRDTNILNYNRLDTGVVRKSKGVTNLGDPEIECEYDSEDAGQDAMRLAGESQTNNYVIRIEGNDAPAAGASPKPTIRYLRALVNGPKNSMGGVEDFNLQMFTLAINDIKSSDPSAT